MKKELTSFLERGFKLSYKMYYENGDKVRVTFVNDKVLIGKVVDWVHPDDSEDDIEELTIEPDRSPENGKLTGLYINFNVTEVLKTEKLN